MSIPLLYSNKSEIILKYIDNPNATNTVNNIISDDAEIGIELSKLKEVPIDKVNKIYSEIDSDYVIKRSKPIKSSQLNLETTMGLIKKKKLIK